MNGRSVGAIVAITAAMLGVTGGIAYAALPNMSGGTAGTALSAAPAYRVVFAPQVGGTAPRKVSIAKCGPGEAVVSGGYDLQGDYVKGIPFSTFGAPAPKAIPVVTSSVPSSSGESGTPNAWKVIAVVPSNFSGKWWLRAYALC